MRNSPDESDASSTPRDWMLGHIDAPQRTWPYYPVPSVARATGVPRDSPAVDDRFRWGARYVRLLGTVRTLYTNTPRLSSPCRRHWSREERAKHLMIVKGVTAIACGRERDLASAPFVTGFSNQACRPVRRFTCLPRGSRLVTVGVALWRCRTVGKRCGGG